MANYLLAYRAASKGDKVMITMPWFRVYSEIIDDRKIKRIAKRTGQTKALVIGVWVCLLALANKSSERGTLSISDDMPYSLEDLEDETDLPKEIIAQLLDEFRNMGMVNGKSTIEITNWSKRQYKSDSSTERVRLHRETKKERYSETLPERFSNVIDTEEDTDTDTDKKKKVSTTDIPAIICNVSGMATLPPNEYQRIEQIRTMLDYHGVEDTEGALSKAYSSWINTKTKAGTKYKRTNMGWVDWAQEILAGGDLPTGERESNHGYTAA